MRVAWVALAITLAAAPAHAYEFWLDSQTIGQAYQLPQYQLVGPSVLLGRRRLTQTLALRIWDIGDLSANRRKARLPDRGLRISLTTYMRIDHDFGDYTSGNITLPGPVVSSAIDVIPELADSSADLQLMYGYITLEGLADDKLKVQLGRLLVDDGWGEFGVDGASARYELPMPIAVTATAGLRVRASSPLGVSSYELDGTSGAGCEEYVVGQTPGTGSWQLIDRNRGGITDYPLSSNVEYCPQRDVDQPSVGVAIATAHTHGWGAEIGYRRTWSDTVGLVGPAQGVDQPPAYLYPNEFGQAPATGVDEERLYGRVHGDFDAGDLRVSPYADARYSILNAVFDRADAGVRLRDGDHILEPEVEYFYPDFDGDSIFNAFSIEATTDARLAYTYAPTASSWRATADAWLRHYAHEDDEPSIAGGFDASLSRAIAEGWRGRIDALWDDGYGGRRAGGSADAKWKSRLRSLWIAGRVILLAVQEDDRSLQRDYVTSSTVLQSSYQVTDGVGIHVIAEADYDAIHNLQTRAIAVLDLAFFPEP
jgi:hypothetical protein